MADRTLTVNGQPFTFNRDRFAGVRKMTSGHVYSDTLLEASFNADGVNYTRISEQAFTVVASNSTAHRYLHLLRANIGSDRLRTGKHRLECNVAVNSGSISSFTGYYTDVDANPSAPTYGQFTLTEGSNVIDLEIFNDGVNDVSPKIMIRVASGSTCDISLTNLKITHNYEEITVDRTADSGGRTMTVTVDALPLTDATTSIKVTVAGHPDLDGIYTGSASTDSTWSQQGGNGQIVTTGYNSEGDYQSWFVNDSNDGDPTQGDGATTWHSTGASNRPWKANLPSSHAVKITGIAGTETITVDRSSDRKGESRPLLSKVVGGAAAAYSLRDLNDKAGNNKVVEVRRSSDDTDRTFLAKEISNGTLTDYVNTSYAKYTSDFSSGDDGWGVFDDVTETGNIDGIGGLDDNLRLAIGSATSQHRAYKSSILPVNQKINFSARVFIPSTNSGVDGILIRDAVNNEIISTTAPAQDQWVTITASNVTVTNAQLRINLMDGGTNNFAGNGSDVIYLREITVTQVTSDGFVSKWYDQSGNGNDAVQATSGHQPPIVKAGIVVDKGIDFDGVSEHHLQPSLLLPTIQNSSVFSVSTKRSGSTGYVAQINRSPDRFYIRHNFVTIGNPAHNFSGGTTNDVKTLQTITATSGGLFTYFRNGTSVGTTNYTGDVSGGDSHIGSGNNGSAEFNGVVSELIIYNTDQSANRLAIEANINNQYDIY